jgi:transposase
VRLIRAIEAELSVHSAERETAYRWADPGQLARTLPGLGQVGGPVLAAVIGAASRFPTGGHFKSYLGLTPRASETGDTDRKGQPMSKAGSRLLRSTLVRAADHGRRVSRFLRQVVQGFIELSRVWSWPGGLLIHTAGWSVAGSGCLRTNRSGLRA